MAIYAKDNGVWKPVKDVYRKNGTSWQLSNFNYVKDAGVWKNAHTAEVVLTAPASVNTYDMAAAFNSVESGLWTSSKRKRLIVNSTRGPIVVNSNYAGQVIIEIVGAGSINGVGGAGGAGNRGAGGAGGDALIITNAVSAGIQVINNGAIRGGGGGGGGGGNGGPGYFNYGVREPSTGHNWQKNVYEYTSRVIRDSPSKSDPNPPIQAYRYWIVWGGTYLINGSDYPPPFRPSMTFGGITYTTEAEWKAGQDSGIYRTYTATTHTSGGIGGAGGRGQGINQANSNGAGGTAGGTNAGAGGAGNWGDGYGLPGLNGHPGGNGNNGSGTAGGAGGAAGRSIVGWNRIVYSGSGSRSGPVANS